MLKSNQRSVVLVVLQYQPKNKLLDVKSVIWIGGVHEATKTNRQCTRKQKLEWLICTIVGDGGLFGE